MNTIISVVEPRLEVGQLFLLRIRSIFRNRIAASLKWVWLPAAMAPFNSYADLQINAVPTPWRLENYIGDTIAIWYTGSTCPVGQLVLNPSATIGDKDRLWATISTAKAKATNKPVVVYYDNSTGNCYITSFGLDSEQ